MRIESGQVQLACFAKIEYFVGDFKGGWRVFAKHDGKISIDIGGSYFDFFDCFGFPLNFPGISQRIIDFSGNLTLIPLKYH
jgi:hypothetical protein